LQLYHHKVAYIGAAGVPRAHYHLARITAAGADFAAGAGSRALVAYNYVFAYDFRNFSNFAQIAPLVWRLSLFRLKVALRLPLWFACGKLTFGHFRKAKAQGNTVEAFVVSSLVSAKVSRRNLDFGRF
jgi:hypothetical protein